MRSCSVLMVTALCLLGSGQLEASDLAIEEIWTDVESAGILPRGDRDIVPPTYRAMKLDLLALEAKLSQAPLERSVDAALREVIFEMPMPDGSSARFALEEAPIMEPELAAKFPELKTYRGRGLDDESASLRLDLTPKGFHGLMLSASGTVWIDPFQRGDVEHYMVYKSGNLQRQNNRAFSCGFTQQPEHGMVLAGASTSSEQPAARGTQPSNGDTLRRYRMAVAATGEYTAFHSAGAPTVAEGLAAVTTAINRLNVLFEASLSISFQLVANNDLIIFTDGNTDPYENFDAVSMMFQNEVTLGQVIGNANFDVGHVFSSVFGGVAIGEVPCTPTKARGASGDSPPVGDDFWLRVVAHEVAHQFGGNHTYNGNSGGCAASQRNADTAFEPGSGSTILSYAGACGSQSLQSQSDLYFHSGSLEEMADFVVNGAGSTCPQEIATGNGIPVVEAGVGHAIPVSTPFELCGVVSDPDGDDLALVWEQFNLGPAGDPNNPVMDAPIFRSWPPTASPCRTFPRLQNLLAGTTVIGELLPTYSRTLTFRLTARDSQAMGGAYGTDSVDIEVTDQAGPFLLTSPNDGTLQGGQMESITWDVAGTQLAPVSCATVDLLLSTDGGLSYPHVLANGTANDGAHMITVPQEETMTARIKVLCSDNIFFDVSNQDLVIEASTTIFADGFESGNVSLWSSSTP